MNILLGIAIILVALSGFSIQINSLKFEWLGVLETIYRILIKYKKEEREL